MGAIASLTSQALRTGAVASALSTVTLGVLAARHGDDPSGPTNATSQWLWGTEARQARGWSVRHTAVGYAVHHAMSCFWAVGYEVARARWKGPLEQPFLAGLVTTLAWWIDFHVMPPRFTPGFEARLSAEDRRIAYAAFAAGLVAGTWRRSSRG